MTTYRAGSRAQSIQRPEKKLLTRNGVLVIVVVVAVVGLLAGFVDNYLGAHVGDPATGVTATTSTTARTTTARAEVAGSLAAFMGLSRASGTAPGFDLPGDTGAAVSLGSLRGKVVVISFFDANCADICPVLAAELRDADRDLGAWASSVTMLTVNADPLLARPSSAAEGASSSDLGGTAGLSNWDFLDGSLAALDAVWKRYGMTIQVVRSTGQVTHNDTMWFITPSGTLAYEATPFADQKRLTGVFTLPAASEARFGAGIAHYAETLLARGPAR